MGVRKDLDSISERFVYHLLFNDKVIYIGTAKNPKSRFKAHLKRAKTENALIYKFIRSVDFKIKMKVVLKLKTTYEVAEKYEIKEIEKHQDTVLNFYNNPNKENYRKIELELTQ